jgi:hypothetical protein
VDLQRFISSTSLATSEVTLRVILAYRYVFELCGLAKVSDMSFQYNTFWNSKPHGVQGSFKAGFVGQAVALGPLMAALAIGQGIPTTANYSINMAPPDPSSSPSPNGSYKWLIPIVGGVTGGVVAIALAALFWLLSRRFQRKRRNEPLPPDPFPIDAPFVPPISGKMIGRQRQHRIISADHTSSHTSESTVYARSVSSQQTLLEETLESIHGEVSEIRRVLVAERLSGPPAYASTV